MQLKELELKTRFRGLQDGFKIEFTHSQKPLNKVNPFCFVGLNGSGKSNLMQLLAEIFYYLELYALSNSTDVYRLKTSFGFRLRYSLPVTPRNFLEGIDDSASLSTLTWRHIEVKKDAGKLPGFTFWYDNKDPQEGTSEQAGKLLPNQVIGYSSGMNEQVSTPFLKMDFYYLESMRRKMMENERAGEEEEPNVAQTPYRRHEMTVNRLHYLDYHSNAMIMLANYLSMENRQELGIINDIVTIEDLVSFRISINFSIKEETAIQERINRILGGKQQSDEAPFLYFSQLVKKVQVPPELNNTINTLMDCATTMELIRESDVNKREGIDDRVRLEMYFKVDAEMRRAIGDKIRGGPMQLFQQLYLLNLLNLDVYSKKINDAIKDSDMQSLNIKAMFTKVADEDKVFHVDMIRLKKKSGAVIGYSQLSDGEHQYLQVAGALKLMNENATLFLMDEPETHLNPEWRSTLFSTLNNILKKRMENDPDAFIPEQEIVVTSHSPFIVSDCQPEQIYIFEREISTGNVKQPTHPDFNTYGASVNFLTAKVFKKKETIAGLANEQLKDLRDAVIAATKTKEQAIEEVNQLGDSVEKIIFIDELSRM